MKTFSRKVRSIIDGDTFRIFTKINGFHKIRLANFNAPEIFNRGGLEAKAKLNRLIHKKSVIVVPRSVSYDRLVADVYLGGVNIRGFL